MIRVSRSATHTNRRRKLILWTAAAAFSTQLFSNAFVLRPPSQTMTAASRPLAIPQTRLFSTGKNDDGFLAKLKNAAKSVLPASWFQSEEEKKAAIERKRVRQEVTQGMREMFKDTPLAIRMFGKMITPLMSSMMSSMTESMAHHQERVDKTLGDAKRYILNDDTVTKALGEPISFSSPFMENSSTTSINGKTTEMMELAFNVEGSRGTGVAQLFVTNDGIQRISVVVDGRTINVKLSSTGRTNKISSSSGDDEVIEAEIIEKKSK